MCCSSPLNSLSSAWKVSGLVCRVFFFFLHLLIYRDCISFPRERAGAPCLLISKTSLSELTSIPKLSLTSHFTVIFCSERLTHFHLSVAGPGVQSVFNTLPELTQLYVLFLDHGGNKTHWTFCSHHK